MSHALSHHSIMGTPKKALRPRKHNSRRDWEEFLRDPARAATLSEEELDTLVARAALLSGKANDGELIGPVREIYEIFKDRATPERRRDNYLATSTSALARRTGAGALLAYLLHEDIPGIVATAALDYAVLRPLADGDALTGPREVLRLALDGAVANGAAAIGGLLMMGDPRVNALLVPIRRKIQDGDVAVVGRCQTGFMFSSTIEFYLDWLEELMGAGKDGPFGSLAGALCRMRMGALVPSVWSIERHFPTTPDDPFRLLGSWPADEYAGNIRPRLISIASRETGARVMPLVLETWGLS